MSSPRKDARWQLATAMAKEAGLDGYSEVTDYPTWEAMLAAADRLIQSELSDAKVEQLARRWNGTEPPEQRVVAALQKKAEAEKEFVEAFVEEDSDFLERVQKWAEGQS